MNKSTITIEYDVSMKKKSVDQKMKHPKTGRMMRERVMVDVKDPRCWEVITVENTISYTPGKSLHTTTSILIMLLLGIKQEKHNEEIGLRGKLAFLL